MRVTRLYLRNYRVYEEPVELELPPGLVGVYGLNGSGKSTLLESIRFALFGRARTSLDQVRTADVNAECVNPNPAEIKALVDWPDGYYVEIHTLYQQNGAVRGQTVPEGGSPAPAHQHQHQH